jgi:hypothetical protein
VFVVHGVGWRPGQAITVTLAGRRPSPERPIVDGAGTFSYAINQDHEFFPGGLPPGTYHVIVTASGGARAEATFTVHAVPGPPGRPGSGAPSGAPPGGAPPGGAADVGGGR